MSSAFIDWDGFEVEGVDTSKAGSVDALLIGIRSPLVTSPGGLDTIALFLLVEASKPVSSESAGRA